MKPSWSPALAALETDLALIEALISEYDDYIEAVMDEAAKRLRTASEGRINIDAKDKNVDKIGQWGLDWSPPGSLDEMGVDVRSWASGAYGGPPGWIRVGIYINKAVPEGLPAVAELVDAAREAVAVWEGESTTDAPSDVCEDDASICVAYVSFPIDALDLGDRLVRAMLTGCEAAERAAEAVSRLREQTPFLWLREILDAVAPQLRRPEVRRVRQGPWEGGRLLEVALHEGSAIWATAFADGALGLHWRCGSVLAGADIATLIDQVGGTPFKVRRWDGVRLFTAEEVKSFQDEDQVAIVRQKLAAAFRTCFMHAGLDVDAS